MRSSDGRRGGGQHCLPLPLPLPLPLVMLHLLLQRRLRSCLCRLCWHQLPHQQRQQGRLQAQSSAGKQHDAAHMHSATEELHQTPLQPPVLVKVAVSPVSQSALSVRPHLVHCSAGVCC